MEQLLKEKNWDINNEKFIQFLEIVQNDWIYTDALERFTKDNIVNLYNVLEYLCDAGIMKHYMQVYCPDCSKFIGKCYETIQDLPEDVFCPHCGDEIEDITKNLILIYRVVGD